MAMFQAPPPQAPTGASAVTPPTPHLVPPTPGGEPPRRQVANVLAIVAVLASWPADLEPRLHAQNAQQNKIAPLTLTYGQQPPQYSIVQAMAQAVAAWPADLEPRLAQILTLRPDTASLIPSPVANQVNMRPFPWTQILSWQPDPLPVPRPVQIAPLTQRYGDQPPISSPLTVPEFTSILANQPAPYALPTLVKLPQPFVATVANTPPPPFPWVLIFANQIPLNGVPVPVKIAPLTLVYGQQPPRQFALSRQQIQIQQTWPTSYAPLWPEPMLAQGSAFAAVGYTVRVTGLDVYQALGAGLDAFQAITTGLDQAVSVVTGLDNTQALIDGLDDVR